jgi:hypothetical protein
LARKVLFAIAALFSASCSTPPGATHDAENELLTLEREWADAEVRRDAGFFERTLADDYLYMDTSGQTYNRREFLNMIESGPAKNELIEGGDMRVHIHGETAVVNGRYTVKFKHGSESNTARMCATDVFIRRRGQWQAVYGHATMMASGVP